MSIPAVAETCRILIDMARPSKGDRKGIKCRAMDAAIKSELVARARHHGTDTGSYVADLLAIEVGRPDLVQVLNKEMLDVTPDVEPVQCANMNYFFVRAAEAVYNIIETRSQSRGIPKSQYVIDVCTAHVRGVQMPPVSRQEVLLLGA